MCTPNLDGKEEHWMTTRRMMRSEVIQRRFHRGRDDEFFKVGSILAFDIRVLLINGNFILDTSLEDPIA